MVLLSFKMFKCININKRALFSLSFYIHNIYILLLCIKPISVACSYNRSEALFTLKYYLSAVVGADSAENWAFCKQCKQGLPKTGC